MAPLGITHSLRPKPACIRPCIRPAGHQLSLLTSLTIFKIPVGEKKKPLRLSLSLGGTLARPSARFCMAFFSRWLGIAGCAVGLNVGAVRPRDAEGAALVSRTELVDGAERSGCAARATFTEREGRPPDFESPERALSSSGFMVDPRAWWCLAGPSALSLHGGGRLSPGNQRRAATAAGRLFPRAHSALAAGRQTKPFSRPRSHRDATPLPSLGTQGPLNATTSVLPASRGAGSEDHFGPPGLSPLPPGPRNRKTGSHKIQALERSLGSYSAGPQFLNLFFQLPYRD